METSSQLPGKRGRKGKRLCPADFFLPSPLPLSPPPSKRRGKKRKHYSLLSKKEKQKELKKKYRCIDLGISTGLVCGKTHFLGLCWFDIKETKTNIQSISVSLSLTHTQTHTKLVEQLMKTTKYCRTAHFSTM